MDDLISRQDLFAEMKKMYEDAEKWRQKATDRNIEARAESCISTLIEMKLRAEKMPSAEQKVLKYTGESICLYCQTVNCDGCMYEPMEGVQ